MRLKFAVIGGDDRSVRLCRLLREDGHEAAAFALERALPCCPDASGALSGADCAVLPLPCTRNGWLNSPFSDTKRSAAEVLLPCARGTPVCAGRAGEIAAVCSSLGLPLYDYYEREDFAVKNASITAEGAVGLLLRMNGGRTLLGSRVLICGFGRIGKLLAMRLRALGARVTAAARSPEGLAWAAALGLDTLDLKVCRSFGGFDFAVNTIPAAVFGKKELESFGRACLLELASPPYGFDLDAAEALGRSVTLAPGLPGVTAPESAAAVLRDTVYNIMEGLS